MAMSTRARVRMPATLTWVSTAFNCACLSPWLPAIRRPFQTAVRRSRLMRCVSLSMAISSGLSSRTSPGMGAAPSRCRKAVSSDTIACARQAGPGYPW